MAKCHSSVYNKEKLDFLLIVYLTLSFLHILCFLSSLFSSSLSWSLSLSHTEEKLNLDESDWEDIHVITGALKLFFRELPEPLVPFGFFTDIVETVSE